MFDWWVSKMCAQGQKYVYLWDYTLSTDHNARAYTPITIQAAPSVGDEATFALTHDLLL